MSTEGSLGARDRNARSRVVPFDPSCPYRSVCHGMAHVPCRGTGCAHRARSTGRSTSAPFGPGLSSTWSRRSGPVTSSSSTNLPSHKGKAVRRAIRDVGARVWFLPLLAGPAGVPGPAARRPCACGRGVPSAGRGSGGRGLVDGGGDSGGAGVAASGRARGLRRGIRRGAGPGPRRRRARTGSPAGRQEGAVPDAGGYLEFAACRRPRL